MSTPLLARCLAGAWAAAQLVGCSPEYPPPAGYIDACYGGNFAKYLNGARPKFSLRIEASQQKWPMLAQRFQDFGKQHNLQYFDTSVTNLQGLHMLNVHLCSPDGLWLYADKRLWDSGPKDPKPSEMPIFLFQYKETYDWKAVAADFAMYMRDWPGKVEIVVPGKDGADSVQLLGANEQANGHPEAHLTFVRADAP